MHPPRQLLLLATCITTIMSSAAARHPDINPDLLENRWDANWIVAPDTKPFDYSVQHFRKHFALTQAPERFVVHVSADNRYQLFVNGERVAWGPARGQLNHWHFETVDLAPHLRAGDNLLAAVVWNFGELAPEAQTTWRTGFIVQGNGEAEAVVNTDDTWKAYQNPAYSPLHFTHGQMRGYFVVGPADRVDGAKYPWGWETIDFDDTAWADAVPVVGEGRSRGVPRDSRDAPNRWLLEPRPVPMPEERPERLAAIREQSGAEASAAFLTGEAPFTVQPNTEARLLLDQGTLTTGYPELIVSGGRGARIHIGYAEALYEPGGRRGNKGNRNEVAGKEFIGYHDIFLPDGAKHRAFRPLWWRTWRYIELTIRTANEPVTIDDLRSTYVGYPFAMRATFDGGSDFFDKLLEVGWRTARLCAHETYMDCPYYEQLQYAGDTRIQCLVSYYNAGDARLARNAIAQLDNSRTAEGATMSRAPTRQQQYITGFSLWWIGMVHDYWMYVNDPEFARQMLPGVRAVLSFFSRYQREDGSLGKLPWWNYVDWTTWPHGEPPLGEDGSSSLHDLQLLLALQWAAELEAAFDSDWRAREFSSQATQLAATIRERYWDTDRRLFSDTAEHDSFSQHANILAVLAGVSRDGEVREIIETVLADKTLTPCSYYFRHYLNTAVNRTGLGDRYLDLLGPWKEMLAKGLTTWAERPEWASNPARSDCHAWSSSPNIELFRTILGIEPAAPGFSRVRIRPFLGELARAAGSIPHPAGDIKVSLRRAGAGGIEAEIDLPPGVAGEFVWQGETHPLASGQNTVSAGR